MVPALDAISDRLPDPACYGVSAHARTTPDKVAIVCGAQRVTYGALEARVNRAARVLDHMGIERGDRVLLVARNSPAHLEVGLAAARRS